MINCKDCYEYKRQIEELKNKIIELNGWKGKDEIEITKTESYWYVKEHRKDKHSSKIKETVHVIDDSAVQTMWKLIKTNNVDNNWSKKGKYFKIIINHYNLDLPSNSFNGGKNRGKHYFPKYYYPLKILEHLRYIEYTSGGRIKILSDKERKKGKQHPQSKLDVFEDGYNL